MVPPFRMPVYLQWGSSILMIFLFRAMTLIFKRDPRVVLGTTFERFCDWYLTFSCPKPGPGRARDRPDFLCLFVIFLGGHFSSRSIRYFPGYHQKSTPKKGTCNDFCRGSDQFWGPVPIRLIRGRWHSPQVAPAAPPAPRVHSSINI